LAKAYALLKDYFESISCQKNSNLILSEIDKCQYDVFVLEMNYKSGIHNGNEGLFWMSKILQANPEAIIVFTTARGDIDLAVRSIRQGAVDFIRKPWNDEVFVKRVIQARDGQKGHSGTKNIAYAGGDISRPIIPEMSRIIGSSGPMIRLRKEISRVATTDANILLSGENGTGKELVARAIHDHSKRSGEIFIKVDMGSLSGSLFESELFGHVRGAYTDAAENRKGRFEAAHKGTLFLDEIANLPLTLQTKLLSVIQNRQVVRVGENTARPVDVRLIAASNIPLGKMVKEGNFREDLYYRLNTINIYVPSLREREGDVTELFNFFIRKFSEKYSMEKLRIDTDVLPRLLDYPWPGNVRELEHAVEKAVIMCDNGSIKVSDFDFLHREETTMQGELETYNLATNELRIIRKAIRNCRGNLSQTARVLGITRKTLYNKINKYGI
jgi:DNA-binding NtrC family response regulator